jgi:hypothetical protein
MVTIAPVKPSSVPSMAEGNTNRSEAAAACAGGAGAAQQQHGKRGERRAQDTRRQLLYTCTLAAVNLFMSLCIQPFWERHFWYHGALGACGQHHSPVTGSHYSLHAGNATQPAAHVRSGAPTTAVIPRCTHRSIASAQTTWPASEQRGCPHPSQHLLTSAAPGQHLANSGIWVAAD